MKIRSVSFDTSFLLKYSLDVDEVINILAKDQVKCFITSVVVSELEQLKIWGRISFDEFKLAVKRWKHAKAEVIDFKNNFLKNDFGKKCMISMKKHHGVKPKDIINDCNILVSTLKNGVDIFLSEDFHFTSKITREVIKEIKNAACSEFHMMCNSSIYAIDSKTFLKTYKKGEIDIDIIKSRMKLIKKNRKNL